VLRLIGRRGPEFFEEALRYFLIELQLRLLAEVRAGRPLDPARIVAIAQSVRFTLPQQRPKRTPLQMSWDGHRIAATPADLLQEYERALAKVQVVKRGRWNDVAAFAQALGQALPEMEMSPKRARDYLGDSERRGGTAPGDIVLDYIISKHRLEFDRDALKKILRLARNPAELMRAAEGGIQRHHSHPLLPIRGGCRTISRS
jgi:hypothetical protein